MIENIVRRIPSLTLLCAHNAEFGLELAEHLKPGAVIMDINLPGLNGFDALKAFKSKDSTRDIPVVALAAEALPQGIQRGREAGFHAYLTKPLDVTLLLRTLIDALRQNCVAGLDRGAGLDSGEETASRGQSSID